MLSSPFPLFQKATGHTPHRGSSGLDSPRANELVAKADKPWTKGQEEDGVVSNHSQSRTGQNLSADLPEFVVGFFFWFCLVVVVISKCLK